MRVQFHCISARERERLQMASATTSSAFCLVSLSNSFTIRRHYGLQYGNVKCHEWCRGLSRHSKKAARVSVDCRRRDGDEHEFGMYPWDWEGGAQSLDIPALHWVQEDTITLFTTDGLMQIGGSIVPRHINFSNNIQGKHRASGRYRRFQEENYMDPSQGLCLGAIFDIAATNGLDLGRRFCIFGFCRSIEMLSDVVEDTVLEQGGEVVVAEKKSKGGLHEKLSMTVAVPLLWGIPPAAERLRFAVRTGGGIVEKVYWQWNFL